MKIRDEPIPVSCHIIWTQVIGTNTAQIQDGRFQENQMVRGVLVGTSQAPEVAVPELHIM